MTEAFASTAVALPSGRSAQLRPPATSRLVLDSGDVVIVTGTLPTFPPGTPPGTVAFEMPSISDVIDLAIDIYDKITDGGGGGGGGGGGDDTVTVTVKGSKGRKVTVVIE
jgi:hypothetical protein